MTGQRHTVSSSDSSAQMHETFGRYRLLGLLGQGGMGRLYIAERRGVRGFVKIVALKLILPHLADSAQLRDMFLNEARIAARLEHPNIVATYELGEVEGKYFISMEYLPGEDLSAVIGRCQGGRRSPSRSPPGWPSRWPRGSTTPTTSRDGQGRLVGLVHRDVNPRNIFVTYHGGVKLLDFGMVRNPAGPKSVPGVFKGKYGYCAPEQLEGGRIDRRTDVFCLGIVLWECLTGARLFDVGTDVETIDAVRSRRIERPGVLRPEVPRPLEEIVIAGAGARTGSALPERPRDGRRAGSVPARPKQPAHDHQRRSVDRGALRFGAGGAEEVDQPGRQRRRSPASSQGHRRREPRGRPIWKGRRAGARPRSRARSGRPASAGRIVVGARDGADPRRRQPG